MKLKDILNQICIDEYEDGELEEYVIRIENNTWNDTEIQRGERFEVKDVEVNDKYKRIVLII